MLVNGGEWLSFYIHVAMELEAWQLRKLHDRKTVDGSIRTLSMDRLIDLDIGFLK